MLRGSLFAFLKKFSKQCTCLVLVTILVWSLFTSMDKSLSSMSSQNDRGKMTTRVKSVLYWTPMWDNKTMYFGEHNVFGDCPVSNCMATYNKSGGKIEDFDAVMFHGIQVNPNDLPRVRSSKQKYIFVDLESPTEQPLRRKMVLSDGFYNWSMTYRRDSDIVRPYGRIIHNLTNTIVYPFERENAIGPIKDLIYGHNSSTWQSPRVKGKTKLIAWFVSHCRTTSQRELFVNEIKKYTDVDVYGKCGTQVCAYRETKCYEMAESRYYFYLSFENSLCQDYVTEKLYNVMNYDLVPIVYGGANYADFAPPGSYINAADFKSAKHLVDYLNYLRANPLEYNKYFWWKNNFYVDRHLGATACKLCEMLNDEKIFNSESVIWDLNEWWTNDMCINRREYVRNSG